MTEEEKRRQQEIERQISTFVTIGLAFFVLLVVLCSWFGRS